MFSVHATPEKLENVTICGRFGFVFEENSGKEMARLWWWCHRFHKFRFQNVSRRHENTKAAFLNSSALKSVFEKPSPFSWRTSVDGRPNRGNKAAFSNYSDVVWTGPWMHIGWCLWNLYQPRIRSLRSRKGLVTSNPAEQSEAILWFLILWYTSSVFVASTKLRIKTQFTHDRESWPMQQWCTLL